LWLVPLGSNYAQRYKLSYKQDPTHWLWVAAGIAAAFNAQLQVFICYRILLVDVSIAAFTIMIAATGAGL
jgi:hypothetical protein